MAFVKKLMNNVYGIKGYAHPKHLISLKSMVIERKKCNFSKGGGSNSIIVGAFIYILKLYFFVSLFIITISAPLMRQIVIRRKVHSCVHLSFNKMTAAVIWKSLPTLAPGPMSYPHSLINQHLQSQDLTLSQRYFGSNLRFWKRTKTAMIAASTKPTISRFFFILLFLLFLIFSCLLARKHCLRSTNAIQVEGNCTFFELVK